jgi:uncharacterized protein (TIGR02996 family)
LDNILCTPDADAPRLRYANWLEGCGNPLGEFIRLQCLLTRRPVSETMYYYERRVQKLLYEFQADWTDILAHRVDWCSYRRGFVEEISLTDEQWIDHAAELLQRAPIVDVHLQSDGEYLDALADLPSLRHTLFLDLSSQPLGDAGVERLAEAPLLRKVHGLNLGSCYLGDAGLDALIDAPDLGALRELYLNDNPITDDSMRRFVLSPIAEQLDLLDVRHTRISREGLDALALILGPRVLTSEPPWI